MSLPVILQGLTLAGILGLIGWAFRTDSRLMRLETILTGATGENGLNGSVKEQRHSLHKLRNEVQGHETRITLLENH